MAYKYSVKLREELIDYFKKYYNSDISDDQADLYLDSLAELFLCFKSINENDHAQSIR
jgi:hypothetical protein